VQGELQTATQVGGGLTLQGADNPIPLVVNTGAAVKNIFATPLLECLGNLHVAGTLSASLYDNVYAPSADVSGEVTCAALSTALFSSDFYVAPGGDDGSGNGSATNPFKTIQRALTQVEITVGNGAKTIHLAPGTYMEDLFINSCVSIVSLTPNAYACSATTITGNVIVSILRGTDYINQNIVAFNGIHFLGNISFNLSPFDIKITIIVDNCFFDFATNAYFLCQTVKSVSELYISNCYFFRNTTTIGNCVLLVVSAGVAAVLIKDSLFEIKLDQPLDKNTQGIFSSQNLQMYNSKVLLHFETITIFPGRTLNCILANATPSIFKNCIFEVLSVNSPSTPYQTVNGISILNSDATFTQNTFNLQYPSGNAISSNVTVTTGQNNVIMPGSLSNIVSTGIAPMPEQ
jgi:hypothetical protein